VRSVRFIVFDGLFEVWLFAASGFCVSFCMVRVFGEVCRRGSEISRWSFCTELGSWMEGSILSLLDVIVYASLTVV
jgi:hypothetical protein